MRTQWTVLAAAVAIYIALPVRAQQLQDRFPPAFAAMDGPAAGGGGPVEEYPDEPQALVSSDRSESASSIEVKSLQALPPDDQEYKLPPNGNVTFNGVDLQSGYEAVRRHLLRQSSSQNLDEPPNLLNEEPVHYERYHWGGLIGQSLLFNLVENTVRIESDDQIRYLLAHRDFWHDYFASLRQFNMGRWNDGDDFLVNYVGHPMQGAVSGFIEIQNSPFDRQLEFSGTREYWKSRFKALLWATVYSTHSELSPIGEAGIGNEGGWTYPINCKERFAKASNCKKYTNNTGWVDFIITPTVGNLWLIAEDVLDRFVSDRIQGGNRSRMLPKIVRGALNPSRTMANALRFKLPWYRDFQHSPETEKSKGVHFLAEDQPAEQKPRLRHFQIMPYFIAMPLGTSAHHCAGCLENPGFGMEGDILLKSWIAFSFAGSRQGQPFEKIPLATGSTANWSAGLRLLHQGPRNTLSLALRTGLIQENMTVPSPVDPLHMVYPAPLTHLSVSHPASSVMFSTDFHVNRFLAVRSTIGDTLVRYRVPSQIPQGIGKPPYLSWLTHDEYTNKSEWTTQIGPVIRF